MNKLLFILLFGISAFFSPAIALFLGILYSLAFVNPWHKVSRKISKYLLQVAVVGLGFGMNLHQSLEAGSRGMLFTVVSVAGVMLVGYFIGKYLKMPPALTHLISSGTAICGGSAIAAIAPVVHADDNETSMSLAVIFLLNAVALFVFPPIGRWLELSQEQFGLWSAISIHDTSSVVGAGAAYGPQALAIATTVKLTRALWIIPLSFVSMMLFRQKTRRRVSIPWFILLFVVAMVINTYVKIPEIVLDAISGISHKFLSMTLFLIGTSLSIGAVKAVGWKPVMLGVSLWLIISAATLVVVW